MVRQRAGSGAQGTGAGQGRGRPGSGGPWVLGCGARTRREGGDASQTLEQTSIMAMRLLLFFLKHFWRQHGRKSWEGQRWGKPGGAAQGVVGVWGLVTGPRGGPGCPAAEEAGRGRGARGDTRRSRSGTPRRAGFEGPRPAPGSSARSPHPPARRGAAARPAASTAGRRHRMTHPWPRGARAACPFSKHPLSSDNRRKRKSTSLTHFL